MAFAADVGNAYADEARQTPASANGAFNMTIWTEINAARACGVRSRAAVALASVGGFDMRAR